MVRLSSSLAAACLGLAGLALACSSSSGSAAATPCNESPFSCPTGQTCWPDSMENAFACLNSVAGVSAGAVCMDVPGAPSCGDAQLCFQQTQTGSGECVAYCDPSVAGHGCASGFTCSHIALETPQMTSLETYVCVPPTTSGGDAGSPDASSSSPDSSASVDSATD